MIYIDKFPAYSLSILQLSLYAKHSSQALFKLIITWISGDINGSPHGSTFVHLHDSIGKVKILNNMKNDRKIISPVADSFI